MKRFLLFVFLLFTSTYSLKAWSQCNSITPVIYWPLEQHPAGLPQIPYLQTSTGEIAPILIDGQVNDWRQYLLGNFSNDNNNPYTPPSYSAANWSKDGINGVDDRDAPTSPRDLNFFAFTYDKKNIFFYFRRINNGNSQNAYYYFCDIKSNNNTVNGPDGFMNNGEPVFRVKYTNGGGGNLEVEILKYVVNTTATGYISGKGNPMVGTTGFADGYAMPGTVVSVAAPVAQSGEIFAAKETETGYGVEFAIPWTFLKDYSTNSQPIPQGNIFTYHVSLLNGSDNINNAQDNAGGCCAGVASSGNPEVDHGSLTVPGSTYASNTYYKTKLVLTESAGAATNVAITKLSFKNLTPTPLPALIDPTSFILKVSKDDNNDNNPDAGSTLTYVYSSLTQGEYTYISNGSPILKSLDVSASARFIIEIEMKNPGIKTFDFVMYYSKEISNTNASLCSPENVATYSEHVENILTPLPVKFSAFNAARNKQQVVLRWETATEQNNRGFYVQRNTKGVWENMAFVFSAADGGNSNELLSYSFNDVNNERGISQYRIQQVDLDGKASYSVIRSVKGEEQMSKTVVYPNPSAEGKVNVVFEDQSAKAVTVSDMSGRVVRQYRSVVNSLVVDGLESGMYTIQITDLSSAVSTTEKVIIKKR